MNSRIISALSAVVVVLAASPAVAADADVIKSREVLSTEMPFSNTGNGLPDANIAYNKTVRAAGTVSAFGREGAPSAGVNQSVRSDATLADRVGRSAPATVVRTNPLTAPRQTGVPVQQRFGRA